MRCFTTLGELSKVLARVRKLADVMVTDLQFNVCWNYRTTPRRRHLIPDTNCNISWGIVLRSEKKEQMLQINPIAYPLASPTIVFWLAVKWLKSATFKEILKRSCATCGHRGTWWCPSTTLVHQQEQWFQSRGPCGCRWPGASAPGHHQ